MWLPQQAGTSSLTLHWAWPPGGCLSPKPGVIWGRTKDCSLQRRALSAQPAPKLPLHPALLNGYKLEDKSTGFQAILPSISGNCRSRSRCVRTEEERRKTRSLLVPSLQQTNRRRASAIPAALTVLAWRTPSSAGAQQCSCCLLSTYCVLVPGS